MKLMLDTNIVVDVISKREGCEESLEILKQCEMGTVYCFVSAVTVTDIMYILRKHLAQSLVREAVQTLLLIVDVANILKSDITNGFSSVMSDYEDAVQASCAKRMKADYIVTRNVKDFSKSPVPAVSPREALEIIRGM